jgi:hypothetical protein
MRPSSNNHEEKGQVKMAHHEIAHLTPEEKVTERKLLRHLDISIMPLIILVYLMNFIDR